MDTMIYCGEDRVLVIDEEDVTYHMEVHVVHDSLGRPHYEVGQVSESAGYMPTFLFDNAFTAVEKAQENCNAY